MGDIDTPMGQNVPTISDPQAAGDISDVDKRRATKVALAVLEKEMLNASTAKDRISAANSALDRFGYPAKGNDGSKTLILPVPPEYLANMARGLSGAFKGASHATDVAAIPEPSDPADDRRRLTVAEGDR